MNNANSDFNRILSVKCVTTDEAYVLEDGTKLFHGGVDSRFEGKVRYLTLLQTSDSILRLREIEIPKFE